MQGKLVYSKLKEKKSTRKEITTIKKLRHTDIIRKWAEK